MAKLSSIIICDGAVLSFSQWTLVGVTRTIWGEKMPFEASFGIYLCCTDVRKSTQLVLELFDPVGAAQGETGALKWRFEAVMHGSPEQTTMQRYTEIDGILFDRAIDHELHVTLDGKLTDVVILEVVG